ncbi:MAG TPA: 16S rRNA (adenine(1518)-N(6)/adenine(1519)-N(6))-dimethyltransferase RsmA [Candidatus Limnocylindrales bacterium]|nr:16S rRNA (adenine(1518)-N(6)/adenine(1519)-N(6))-dimethyltransferase RsmA [Candidatus Limnocylindrales bacterium]
MGSRVRWGQCFLIDRDAARRIIDWAAIEGRAVVEIGPGRGALTGLLRERAASLTLVEIDPELAAELTRTYAGDPRVTVIEGDALRVDWISRVEAGFTVVANLPYESGTAIVSSILKRRDVVREIDVMLQKEVVARLAAAPGSKVYGGLSVIVQMLADVERGMVIAPRSFRPRPRVESQMVRLRPRAEARFEIGDEAEFVDLVHAAFGQRRKMLRNNLGRYVESRFGEGAAERVLAAANVPGDVRPEDLGLAEFAALSLAVVRGRDAQSPRLERAEKELVHEDDAGVDSAPERKGSAGAS